MSDDPQIVAQAAYQYALYRATSKDGRRPIESEEIALKAALLALQQHYALQAEPWLKRLYKIEAMRPVNMIIPIQEAENLRLTIKDNSDER